MSKLISFALSFFSGDKKLYIALGLSLILLGYFYLRLDSTKAKLEKSQSDLALALEINRNNEAKLKELTQIHKAELKAINEANTQKNEVKESVQYVKEYIYKSNENNITKLLMMSLIGCGMQTQQVVTKIEIQKVTIPQELLTLSPLEKPIAKNELDILNAYSMLFYKYKQCEIQISKIKELNNE